MGIGKTIVELFSVEISTIVWSCRSCRAPGWVEMTPAASVSLMEACSSPSAAMIFARRSRSASAWRAIARCICSGSPTSRISTRWTLTPHGSVWRSRDSASSMSIRSRSLRSWSSSWRPTMARSVVWATSWLAVNQFCTLMTDAAASTTWK